MTDRVKSRPSRDIVTVGAYPTCDDCLSWSDESIAVSAGPHIYLLQQQGSSAVQAGSGSKYSTTTLRVDQFNDTEWPEQKLSSLRNLSIGEEQSESSVVAVQFSPPGLGIHCRSVLAVLTSNLLLTIWETDGSQQGWRRTWILNPAIQIIVDNASHAGKSQRQTRIRAFAWARMLPTRQRWGRYFMAAIDDEHNLILFEITKQAPGKYGGWHVTSGALSHLLPSTNPENPAPQAGGLRRILAEQSPYRKVEISAWQNLRNVVELSRERVHAIITCSKGGQLEHSQTIHQVELSSIVNGSPTISTCNQHSNSAPQLLEASRAPQQCGFIHSLKEVPEWRPYLEPLCTEYDKNNSLQGLFRIRFWGFATSPDGNSQAACVSLHPWDRYEYSSAVHEKSYVVIRSTQNKTQLLKTIDQSEASVIGLVVENVVQNADTGGSLEDIYDHRLIKILQTWSLSCDRSEAVSSQLAAIKSSTPNGITVESLPKSAERFVESSKPEKCDLCGAGIVLEPSSPYGVCDSGHVFTRCKLTLISIQEPGISKYCSRCNRQFLSISKLGPRSGQSLLSRVLAAFDLCPYCGGNYRG